MGRKSRAKRERREFRAKYGPFLKAAIAEFNGRRLPPTLERYTEAFEARGERGVIEALLARMNWRWDNTRQPTRLLSDETIETLHAVYLADMAQVTLGADLARSPQAHGASWPDHLMWASDSACQAFRFLMAGNALGAAAIARLQLERWSANAAHSAEVTRHDGEPTAEFYARAWSSMHPDITDAGELWTILSELLHGRGPLVPLVRWESQQLCSADDFSDVAELTAPIVRALQISLRQARNLTASVLYDAEHPPVFVNMLAMIPDTMPPEIDLTAAPNPDLLPYNFNVLTEFGDMLEEHEGVYAQLIDQLVNGEKPGTSYSEMSALAYLARRGRSARWARIAMEREREHYGNAFNPGTLEGREFSYIIVAETCGLVALWTEGHLADALSTAASALRAAYWLWLEDDDTAMSLARTVIEQTARARTWRLKPTHAQRLESKGPRTSSRDWLREAGWQRLSLLNRSLGEFSHIHQTSQYDGARQALVALQFDADVERSTVTGLATARGSALNRVALFLSHEIAEQLDIHAPQIAPAIRAQLLMLDENAPDAEIERHLDHAWKQRAMSFSTT